MSEANGAGQQIPLGFQNYHQLDFDSFETEAAEQLTLLQQVVTGKRYSNIYIWGQRGTGKSHFKEASRAK